MAQDELLVVAFDGERLLAAGPASGSLELDGGEAHASAELGDVAIEAQASGAGNGLRAGVATAALRSGGSERPLEALAVFGPASPALGSEQEEPGLVRRLSALPSAGGTTIVLSSHRPAAAADHEAESLSAWLLPESGELCEVAEPLLSTQYDGTGAQARAGLELWVGESDAAPLRVSGVRRADVDVELADRWRLRAASFRWLLAGDEAEGSYLIWRRGA